jgi:hypothetical protein
MIEMMFISEGHIVTSERYEKAGLLLKPILRASICADGPPAKVAAEEVGREAGAVSTGPNNFATLRR